MKLISIIAAAALLSTPAFAANCRDAKGKFVKCPTKVLASARCKNAKGQFAKCGTAGAMPVK